MIFNIEDNRLFVSSNDLAGLFNYLIDNSTEGSLFISNFNLGTFKPRKVNNITNYLKQFFTVVVNMFNVFLFNLICQIIVKKQV